MKGSLDNSKRVPTPVLRNTVLGALNYNSESFYMHTANRLKSFCVQKYVETVTDNEKELSFISLCLVKHCK